ncbi:MAG TPA: rod shape-determining protein MreC [Spirochaetales bacterium]|nr:rod shape-determining protein MreC [Spirochaetales bacterium]
MRGSPKASSPERLRRAVPVVLLAASLVVLTVSTRSLAGLPERVGVTVFGFFQKGFSAVGDFVSDTIASIAELKRLRKDYDELTEKLEAYTNMERGNAELREENERLKAQLGFSERLSYERVPARIVAKDPENLYATIVIDKGVAEGVRKNMPVIAFQDGVEGLVGRVLEVGMGSSIVVPVYDSSSYVAARLAASRYEGLAKGQGSADSPLVMKYVKKRAKDEAQFGDLVVTTGYESIYPPDVTLGRVKKLRILDYQTSVEIEVEPALDFSRLEYVLVVRPSAPAPAADGEAPAPGGLPAQGAKP